MPLYDYYCEANDQTVEVMHSIKIDIKTWGELCKLKELDPGKTPKDTPVKRLLSAHPRHLSWSKWNVV